MGWHFELCVGFRFEPTWLCILIVLIEDIYIGTATFVPSLSLVWCMEMTQVPCTYSPEKAKTKPLISVDAIVCC